MAEEHAVHAEKPIPSAYDTPVGQAVQTETPAPEYAPTLQDVHTEEVLAPAVTEYVPEAHDTQVEGAVAPTVTEYVPAVQRVQDALVSAPVDPR